MTYRVENLLKYTTNPIVSMVYTPSTDRLWAITQGPSVSVLSFEEGLNSGYAPNFYDDPIVGFVDQAQIGIVSDYIWTMHDPVADKVYLAGTNADSIWIGDVATSAFEDEKSLPGYLFVNRPTVGNGKVWYVDAAPTTSTAPDRQTLYYFDLGTDTISAGVTIPCRKQFEPIIMEYDHVNNFVVILNYNNSSLMKFNGTTGAHVSTIMVNRRPTSLYVAGGYAHVGSKNGMYSVVDLVADTTQNLVGTFTEARGIVADGSFLWAIVESVAETDSTPPVIAGALSRTLIGGSPYYDNYRVMTGQGESYSIATDQFVNTDFTQIALRTQTPESPASTYLIIANATELYAFRTNSMYRKPTLSVRGTAMIATGPESYFGETT